MESIHAYIMLVSYHDVGANYDTFGNSFLKDNKKDYEIGIEF